MFHLLVVLLVNSLFFLQTDAPQEATFPDKRLDEWVEFLNRAPARVGKIEWNLEPSKSVWGFLSNSKGSLGTMTNPGGVSTETITNGDYSATIVLREGAVPKLERIGDARRPAITSNGFFHTSSIKLFAIPDMIRQKELQLVNAEALDSSTRYQFDCPGKQLSDDFDGVTLEFDHRYSIPVYVQERLKFDGKVVLQQFRYVDFIDVNGEWVPTRFESSLIDEGGGNPQRTSATIKYDPSVEVEPNRFRLGYYNIPEPEFAKRKSNPGNGVYFWLAAIFLVAILVIVTARNWPTR